MAPPINRSMTDMQWVMLVSLSILWGGSFFFTAIAIKELPSFTIVTVRVGLAAAILNAMVCFMGLRLPTDGRVWTAFFGMGLLNNAIPFSLIVWGQTHIGSGLASILNATTPLWTVIIAHFSTTDEKMTSPRLLGVVVGFTGVVVMIGPEPLARLGDDVMAQLAVLAAALSYAFAGVFGRRFAQMGIVPMLTAAGQVSASALILIPVALVVDQPWRLEAPSLHAWAALIGIAALSTALAYVLYFQILRVAGATNLLLVTFLIPVSAIVLGSTILGEKLDPRQWR
jgi:drug/metabolite transporter (DMT)-like permease